MTQIIWVLVRLHKGLFCLEVNVCVFNKFGENVAELLLPVPSNHSLVQFVDNVHQVFVLRIDNANLDAVSVAPGE
jgi:hypothetical protein